MMMINDDNYNLSQFCRRVNDDNDGSDGEYKGELK